MDKYEQLKLKIDEMKTKTLVAEEMKAFVSLVLKIVKDTKDELADTSKENIKVISDSIAYIKEYHDNTANDLSGKSEALLVQMETKIALINKTLDKVKKIKATPGKDGKSVNKDEVVAEVMSQIQLPEYKETVLDNGDQIITKINDSEEVIKAERVEGFTTYTDEIKTLQNRTQLLLQISTQRSNGGSSVGAFIDLTDVPNSYAGQSGKAVRVKATEDGLEFFTASGSGTVTQVDTAGLISGGPINTTGTITTSMATNKLVGRGTAGTGIMEEITLGTGLALTGTTLNVSGFVTGSGTIGKVPLWTTSTSNLADSALTQSGSAVTLAATHDFIAASGVVQLAAGVQLINSSGNLTLGGGYLVPTAGGTGFVGYTAGDVLYADSTTTLAKLAQGANGTFLGVSGGVLGYYTPAGSGTVTNTGTLTLNSIVLGNGTTDVKVVAGITTDGTSQLNLGVASTTAGALQIFGGTSGSATIQTPAVAGTTTITLPGATGTLATLAGTEALTNKSVNGVTLVTGGTATKYLSEDGTYTTPSGGGGLTNWTEAYSAATQATSSFTATNAASDVNAALIAKGTGATVAQVPDGTATAGNSRGQYATDWQKIRNTNDMVASGNYSTIGGGERNKVVGSWATVAGGYNNRAASSSSAVGGGESNNISAGSAATIAGGSSNSSTQNYTSIGGGISNSITGAYATIVGGNTNATGSAYSVVGGSNNSVSTTSGNYATCFGYLNTIVNYIDAPVISGGRGNTVNSVYGTVAGGYANSNTGRSSFSAGEANTTSADYTSVAGGYYADAHLYSERAFASGRFAAVGDAQAADLVWRRSITGTSATELFLDGASVRAILKSGNTAWTANIKVVATTSSLGNGGGTVGNSFSGEYLVSIKRLGSTTTLIGTVQTIATTADTNMTASVVTITADDTNEALKIEFTPDGATAGTTTVTRVVARGTIAEVRY